MTKREKKKMQIKYNCQRKRNRGSEGRRNKERETEEGRGKDEYRDKQ